MAIVAVITIIQRFICLKILPDVLSLFRLEKHQTKDLATKICKGQLSEALSQTTGKLPGC